MKLSIPFAYLVLAIGIAEASNHHAQEGGLVDRSLHARIGKGHGSLVKPVTPSVKRRGNDSKRRCKPRPSSTKAPEPTKAAEPANAVAKPDTSKQDNGNKGSNNDNKGSDGGNKSGGSTKINTLVDNRCGPSGATEDITTTSGPNGSLDWFNCGLENGGWTPPNFTVDQVHAMDLGEALNKPNSPFKPCAPYIDLFYKYGEANGIPPIMVASIAMQESTCNPHTVGGGGEQGLMQITKEKCGGAPGGNCQDPEFNVRVGAGFLGQLIKNNGGNILKAVGSYNGWFEGLTKDKATAARWTNCCKCMNNLDYLAQFLLGWVNGIDPRSRNPRIGKYFNLDVCYQ